MIIFSEATENSREIYNEVNEKILLFSFGVRIRCIYIYPFRGVFSNYTEE